MSVLSLLDPDYLTTQMGKWFKLDEALAWCVTFRLIRPSQQIRELSVFNGARENAEDAVVLRRFHDTEAQRDTEAAQRKPDSGHYNHFKFIEMRPGSRLYPSFPPHRMPSLESDNSCLEQPELANCSCTAYSCQYTSRRHSPKTPLV
jgi:hypothetical protein